MKLATPFFNTVLTFNEGTILTLVIESQPCLYVLLDDLTKQLAGNEGSCILSENEAPIPFSKHAELIDTFVPFSLNRKTLLTKITGHMEQAGTDETHYLKTQELLANIERYFNELSFDLPCEIGYDKLNLPALIRAAGISVIDDTPDPLEKLLLYMELVRTLDKDRLFIFLNFRCYFDDEQAEKIMQSVIDHKYCILMLETSDRPRLSLERRLTIDKDRCEF